MDLERNSTKGVALSTLASRLSTPLALHSRPIAATPRRRPKSEHLVHLSIGKQTGIRRDFGAMEFQRQTPVETQSYRFVFGRTLRIVGLFSLEVGYAVHG